MKRKLFRLAAVITAVAFLLSVQAAYEDRIPKRLVYAAMITLTPTDSSQETTVNTESTESTEDTGTTDSAEGTEGSTESTEGTEGGTESTEGSTESTEGTEGGTESTEDTESTETTESIEETETSESTEVSESNDVTESVEVSESNEPVESSQAPEVEESSEIVPESESEEMVAEEESEEEENAWKDVLASADTMAPPSYEHLHTVTNTYTPVEPKDAVAEGFHDEFVSSFNQIIEESTDEITGEISDNVKEKVLDIIQDTAKDMSKDYYNQAYKDYVKAGDLLNETVSDRNSYRYFLDNDFMDATHQKYSDALDLMDNGSVKVFKGDIAHLVDSGIEVYNKVGDAIDFVDDAVGVVGDAITIVEDGAVLITGDFKHEHSSWRAVEATLLVTDIGLAAVSIGATVGLVTLGPVAAVALGVGSIVVGVSSAFVRSDAFADYMNSTDGSFQSFLEGLFPWMRTPDGVNCYKPNIYIYDKDGRRIKVIFTVPELLIVSIPEYEAGWTVDSSADGNLVTEAGEEYDFLFYESHTVKGLFDTQSGFRIDATDRQTRWENILTEYGFNEEEIQDFIEFWNVKLDADKDYIMYPQYTETVDEAMPIIVEPYPENMIRIWFVFEEYKGQEYREEQIESFSREGYTVVEWGGMIF